MPLLTPTETKQRLRHLRPSIYATRYRMDINDKGYWETSHSSIERQTQPRNKQHRSRPKAAIARTDAKQKQFSGSTASQSFEPTTTTFSPDKNDVVLGHCNVETSMPRQMSRATGLPFHDQLYTNLSFSDRGLDALQDGEWVSDEPVDLFCILETEQNDDVYYIPSSFYTYYFMHLEQGINKPSLIPWRSSARSNQPRHRMHQAKLWIATICDHGHWQVLCIVNPGQHNCFLLLLDSLVKSPTHIPANFRKCEQFARALVEEAYSGDHMPNQRLPSLHMALVPVQPNFVDCGIFAIENVKMAISQATELTSLQPASTVQFFQDWYTVEQAVNERNNLRMRYEDFLNEYGKPSDEIHVVYEA
jgi:hypothetical protein